MMTNEEYDKLSFQEKYDLFAIEGWSLEEFPAKDRYDIGIAAVQNKLISKSDVLSVLFRNNDVEYLKKVNEQCPTKHKQR